MTRGITQGNWPQGLVGRTFSKFSKYASIVTWSSSKIWVAAPLGEARILVEAAGWALVEAIAWALVEAMAWALVEATGEEAALVIDTNGISVASVAHLLIAWTHTLNNDLCSKSPSQTPSEDLNRSRRDGSKSSIASSNAITCSLTSSFSSNDVNLS